MDPHQETQDFCAAATPEARAALAARQLASLTARDAVVRAFVCSDAEGARKQLANSRTGPLAGALIGVKDIIATAEFATRYGAPDANEPSPRRDAWCVARARQLGAIVLGKTVCTELAVPIPGPTTNPHDRTRTPGGSSSGSAAAVAAGFVSFAIGTQTAGSTIRPASYCGITGYKPSYGLLPTEGVQPDIVIPRRPRRVLVLRLPPEIPQADAYPERMAALATSLAEQGIEAQTIDLPFPVDDFRHLQRELCYWEAARLLLAASPADPAPQLQSLLAPWLERDMADYAAASRRRLAYQAEFETLIAGSDAVLLPAATGAAPLLAGTGDAVMNRFWTALHVPAMTVPLWRSADGLPLGLQMIGGNGTDRRLAEVAQWLLVARNPRLCVRYA
jgi:Asp-tRNA(Asn)/Glu-tRNA(Gln) amidotransferase A subunit family amidase